jgi:hypothetical protein
MPTLTDLLSDPGATIELVAGINALDETDTPFVQYISQRGWDDPVSGTWGSRCPPLLSTEIEIDFTIDPLNPASSYDALSELVFANDLEEYPGYFDGWWKYSVDKRACNLYAVGVLSDGTRVELADVGSTPLFRLYGVLAPEVNSTECVISVRGVSYLLSTPLQPDTYAGSGLVFPGTVGGSVGLGDNLDITSSTSISIEFYTEDPSLTLQFLLNKNGALSGYYVLVGLVGAGTVSGGVEIVFPSRTPTTATSAANLIRAYQVYTLDIAEDTAAGTRRIDLDGVTIISQAGITGSLVSNTSNLTFGSGLKGRIGRVLYWSGARSNAVMSAEMRVPMTGAEASLTAYFPHNEKVGSTTHDRKSGSSLTGTLGTGVTWGSIDRHYTSILGKYQPWILGTVLRAPLTWIDTFKQIGEVSYGGCAHIAELQSNHAAVSAASYTTDLSKGILTLTSGSISGTYSTTATANNLWNSAIQTSSTSSILATINSPTGSRTFVIQFRPDRTLNALAYIIGWQTSAQAGSVILRFTTGAQNLLNAFAINDASTIFSVNGPSLTEGRTYTLAVELDVAGSTLGIWVDAVRVITTPISGAWTTVRNQFGIGVRADTGASQGIGRFDEALIFNRVLTAAEHKALHLLPATGGESGLLYGWHMDNASGASATSMLGGTALTLSNITWTGGRSAATDLARVCYYRKGYVAADLDSATWQTVLTSQPADCGWFVDGAESADAVLSVVLGGLGIVAIEIYGIVYLFRFEGVPTPTLSIEGDITLENAPIDSEDRDPAIYRWEVIYATNNTRMDQSSVAQSLAASDPDRYQYGAAQTKVSTQEDYSIKSTAAGADGRFPNAEEGTRQTALIYARDADNESVRLLALHREGADVKSIPTFLTYGDVRALTGIEIDVEELELSASNWVVTGLRLSDERIQVIMWRPGV